MSDLEWLLRDQDGVIARRQAITAGLTPTDVNRLLRRRVWAPVHTGVYVDHTGPLTWLQRAWGRGAALRACGTELPVGARVVHRTARLDESIEWNRHPPRVNLDHALLDVAAEAAHDLAAVATLADACGSRRTTPARLLAALELRPRLPRRAWIRAVLVDMAEGTCSVLEHGYLTKVERPHGLPRGRRQAPAAGGVLGDVDYDVLRLVVELDGRQFHASAGARDRDLDRDLDAAALGGDRQTIRLGYGQVFGRGCRTAYRVGLVMKRRGWTGSPRPAPAAGEDQPRRRRARPRWNSTDRRRSSTCTRSLALW